MKRRRNKRDDAPPSDPSKGPGAVAVEKLASDPDIGIAKRIVRRGSDYCVLAENSDRSFGCFPTRAAAARRLREVERFAGKIGKSTHAKPKKAEEDGDGGSTETRVSTAPHVHTIRLNGAELVTSSDEGSPHSHRVTLPGGRVATVSRTNEGPGHTHNVVVDGKTLATSGPRSESERAKPKKKKTPAKKSDGLPAVLTFKAVRAGEMPELGESGLPNSLEQDVPPRFRFWKCEDAEDARLVRDALVESGLFEESSIRDVSGESRRVITELVEKHFLPKFPRDEPPAIPADVRPILRAASFLAKTKKGDDGSTVLLDRDVVETFGVAVVVERAKALASDWLISAPDDTAHRIALKSIGGAYRLRTIDDVIFATSSTFVDHPIIELVEPSREEEVITKALTSEIRIVKSDEERIVYGVVLEPNTVDKQQDTISEEEIRSAAHKFMEDFGLLGLQHKEIINGDVKLLETFIAPTDFKVGSDTITKGSWVMAERIINDSLWKAVKADEITGFSIGGSAVRRPV